MSEGTEHDPIAEPPAPQTELCPSADQLRDHRYIDADERIEALATLPRIIRLSPSEAELERQVVTVLLRGSTRAEAAAVLHLPAGSGVLEVRAAHGHGANWRPSQRLVKAALRERRRGVLHVWHHNHSTSAGQTWALCTPLPEEPHGDGSVQGLYVSGRLGPGNPAHDLLKSDLKFAGLVADIFGQLRHLSKLQGRIAKLGQFFPRPVMDALAGKTAPEIDEILKPCRVDVTVLFCDIRGSSLIAEAGRDDLLGIWRRIEAALEIMSRGILDQGGVIADFQGDAVMGFWGWPLEAPNQIEQALKAALEIRRRFTAAARDTTGVLAGFAFGMGLAHGPALAGRLGTAEQLKIDVFGPTVNLASRLEGLTRHFGVGILMDEACAAGVAGSWARGRRLARVQPYGMTERLTVAELLLPQGEPGSLNEEHRTGYEAALDQFLAGAWTVARAQLARLQPNGPAAFLLKYMDRFPAGPPPGWDGVLVMEMK
jgi:adenylate cyclase